MESEVSELIKKNFEERRKALKLLLEAAKVLEQAEREGKQNGK